MSIPEGRFDVAAVVVPVDLHQRRAGFDEAARQQEALAEGMHAIAIAHAPGFQAEIEGAADRGAGEQVARLTVQGIVDLAVLAEPAELPIERAEQVTALVEPADGHIRRQGQFVEAERQAAGRRAHQPGIEAAAEKASLLSRIVVGQIEEAIPARQRHGRRHARPPTLEPRDQGAHAGEIVRCRRRVLIGTIVAAPGQHVIEAPAMPRVLVRHAAQQAVFAGLARQPGQVLADAQPGDAGGDRVEFPAKMRRGIRLEVERVELAGPTEQVHENASPRPCPRRRLGQGELREGQSERPCGADLQDFTARGAIAGPLTIAQNAKHDWSLIGRGRQRKPFMPAWRSSPCR